MMEQPHHTAAYKIFNYFVECMIPAMYLYSQEYVKKFGLYTSGDADVDAQTFQSTVKANLTVAQMAQHMADGAALSLLHPEESKQIYQWIVEHINDWTEEVTKDPNRRDVPVEDLRLLDQFAKEIYPMARQHMTTQVSGSRLFRSLDRINRRATVKRDLTTPEQIQNEVPKEHSPMAQVIAAEVSRRGGVY
jgi:hypothetical protein